MEGFKYTYWTSNTVLNHLKYYRNEWRFMNWKNQFSLHTAVWMPQEYRWNTAAVLGLLSNLFVSDHKPSKVSCYSEKGRGNNTESNSSLSSSSLIIQGNKVTQIKQNHRHYETENELLMGRRKVCNIAIQESQIKPKQSKQNHRTQNCVNSDIVYPVSGQLRQSTQD